MNIKIDGLNKGSAKLNLKSYKTSHGGFVGEVESTIGNRPDSLDFHYRIASQRNKLVKIRNAYIKNYYIEEG